MGMNVWKNIDKEAEFQIKEKGIARLTKLLTKKNRIYPEYGDT